MNLLMTILTQRELFLLIIGSVTYIALFVVTVQNSRRKILLLQDRLERVKAMQEAQDIEANRQKIAELEALIERLGSENSMLRLELEERKARLDYANTLAIIDSEKRQQAETTVMGSDIYLRLKQQLADGRSLADDDWSRLSDLVNSVYTGFAEKLFSLYRLSEQDYRVCLLIKVRVQPKDIATLTAHSKESVASTRSRLYQKIFGKKGTTREWDDFVLSL